MHEQYMNFFKAPKKSPTDTLHRKSEKVNEKQNRQNGAERGIENKGETSKKDI